MPRQAALGIAKAGFTLLCPALACTVFASVNFKLIYNDG